MDIHVYIYTHAFAYLSAAFARSFTCVQRGHPAVEFSAGLRCINRAAATCRIPHHGVLAFVDGCAADIFAVAPAT